MNFAVHIVTRALRKLIPYFQILIIVAGTFENEKKIANTKSENSYER